MSLRNEFSSCMTLPLCILAVLVLGFSVYVEGRRAAQSSHIRPIVAAAPASPQQFHYSPAAPGRRG
jgi:hypothetical protein